jgi:hypothetical protein
MLYELPCDVQSFIFPILEYKISLHYKTLKFPTEIFGDLFFYNYVLCTRVGVCVLDLHVGAVFGVMLSSSV